MGSWLAITIIVAAFVMQTINSIPVEDQDNLCMCNRIYDPICGSDQHTYNNQCLFDCEKERNQNLEIQFYGDCEGTSFTIPIDGLHFNEEDFQFDNFPANERNSEC